MEFWPKNALWWKWVEVQFSANQACWYNGSMRIRQAKTQIYVYIPMGNSRTELSTQVDKAALLCPLYSIKISVIQEPYSNFNTRIKNLIKTSFLKLHKTATRASHIQYQVQRSPVIYWTRMLQRYLVPWPCSAVKFPVTGWLLKNGQIFYPIN